MRSWPIRARLTALYASAFLAAGAVLLTFTYVLVSESLFVPGDLRSQELSAGERPDRNSAIREALLDYRDSTLDRLLFWSIVALVVTLVLAVLLGWFLAGRALAPLQQVTATARRVADTNLHERIDLTGPHDEVKELADTIDAMLERLDRSFEAQRRFVANASHELRTPLAVNRTLVEVAASHPDASDEVRDLAKTVLLTTARSERLVEGLLTLARAGQDPTSRVAVDLADVAAVVAEQEATAAREAGIELKLELDPAPVLGSGVLLERMVANLVQNAIRHGTPGPAVVRTGSSSGTSYLEVSNAGPTLRGYEVEELFEPFRRGRERLSDDGVGLGLAIVRSVSQGLGGRATATPREGGGIVVRVEIPGVPVSGQGEGPDTDLETAALRPDPPMR